MTVDEADEAAPHGAVRRDDERWQGKVGQMDEARARRKEIPVRIPICKKSAALDVHLVSEELVRDVKGGAVHLSSLAPAGRTWQTLPVHPRSGSFVTLWPDTRTSEASGGDTSAGGNGQPQGEHDGPTRLW